MMNKAISYTSGKFGRFLKVCGFTLAHNPWGNCFSPALCVNTATFKSKPFEFQGKLRFPSRVVVTFRARSLETVIHWRGGLRFDWNSAHLARRFGKFSDTDFGGVTVWNGFLGHHVDI